ncbi:ABC transporter ATP-binding protein [Spirillospora sp. NBC_01491]|uniref:ABC transporter ATP-binding protein n=1 Tax=Spirillospora sp. NBC_01491 TaxID=2976007 RepID=UPI002E306D0E|nr:ABC transporter ATP-binding protein [Spirillospora sp. NBC_01491]
MTLRLEDVTVVHGKGDAENRVLDGLDVELASGGLTAVVGPSGSGKSTLLAVAGALLRPASGRVLLDGTDLAALNDAQRARIRRERIGYMFQSGNLLPNFTAVDQILTVAHLTGRRPGRHRARAEELLEAVGLAHRRGHRPEQLSGGERQRVALARALFLDPPLLLVDEPTAAVDRGQAGALTGLLVETAERQDCIAVVATHDPVVADAAGRVVDMARLTAMST